MIKVNIPAVQKEIKVGRVLGEFKGEKKSPSIIFLAGIHGNETSGLYAIQKVFEELNKSNMRFRGNIYAFTGNMTALKENVRFKEIDLNRIWTHEQIKKINGTLNKILKEEEEQIELFHKVHDIIRRDKGPFIFIDLHTTSAHTTPFITISDSINNRKYSSKFPVPVVLGIEEYLDGPFLSFINEFGHVALGFEAGQHEAIQSVIANEAFIWLSLVNSGCIRKSHVPKYQVYFDYLSGLSDLKKVFFEIDYRYQIESKDDFKMHPNFINFDKIHKNQELAINNKNRITAPLSGKIFMPLYQKQGNDGFFIVRKISMFWLGLSKILRKLHLHNFLRILPGIKRYKKEKHILMVDRKTALFLATEIFHLFGYRKKIFKKDEDHWLFIKRDRKVSSLFREK